MFLLVSVLHSDSNLCSYNYLVNDNKQKLLKFLSDDSKAEEVMIDILAMSKNVGKNPQNLIETKMMVYYPNRQHTIIFIFLLKDSMLRI